MFTKLLAMTMHYEHNVHLLHFKLCGKNFIQDHTYLGELYSTMQAHVDQIGELGLMVGVNPLTLQECLSVLDGDSREFITVSGNNDYDSETAFKLVSTMFREVIEEIDYICNNNRLSEGQKNDLSALSAWYEKVDRYIVARILKCK